MATRRLLTTATTTTLRRLTTAKTTPHFSLLRTLSATSHLTPPTLPPSSRRLFCTEHAPIDNIPNPNPKKVSLPEGCDFDHWLVIMDPPPLEWSREQIIDYYVKTLATVFESEDEARMKIYSVSTKHYFAFGALMPEEELPKLKELEQVRWVLPDAYLDVKNKDYGGEPFINGQAVPYDPKYHQEWVRNSQKAGNSNNKTITEYRMKFESIENTLGGNVADQLGPPINAGGGPNMLPPNTAAGDQNAPNGVHQSQNFPGEDAPVITRY